MSAYEKLLDGIEVFEPEKESGEFVKGLKRGVDQTQAMGAGLAATVGAATGIESLEAAGMRGYREQNRQASDKKLNVNTAEEIDGLGSTVDFAMGKIGEMVPQVATMLAGGGIGGIAGRAVVKRGIKKNIAKGMDPMKAAEAAAKSIANKAGTAAATGTSVGIMTGGIGGDMGATHGEIHAGKALAGGALAGSLEVLPIFNALGKMKGAGAVEGLKNRVAKIVKDATGTGIQEAGTEVLQSAIEQGAVEWVKTNIDDFTQEQITELFADWKTAGLAGFFGGGAMGGAGSAAGQLIDAAGKNAETKTESTPGEPQEDSDSLETSTPLAQPVGDPTVESASFPERTQDQLPATIEGGVNARDMALAGDREDGILPELDFSQEDAEIEEALADPELPPELRQVLEGELLDREETVNPALTQEGDTFEGETVPLEGEYQPRGEGVSQDRAAIEKQGQVIDYADYGKLDTSPALLENGTERAKQDADRIESKIDISLQQLEARLKAAAENPTAKVFLESQKRQLEDKKLQLADQRDQIQVYEQDAKDQRRWLESFNAMQGLAQPKEVAEGQTPKLAKIKKSDVVREGDAMPDDIQAQIFDAYQRMHKAGLPPEAWNDLTASLPEDINGKALADEIDRRTAIFNAPKAIAEQNSETKRNLSRAKSVAADAGSDKSATTDKPADTKTETKTQSSVDSKPEKAEEQAPEDDGVIRTLDDMPPDDAIAAIVDKKPPEGLDPEEWAILNPLLNQLSVTERKKVAADLADMPTHNPKLLKKAVDELTAKYRPEKDPNELTFLGLKNRIKELGIEIEGSKTKTRMREAIANHESEPTKKLTNRDLKKEIADELGIKPGQVTLEQLKSHQEKFEAGLVGKARSVIEAGNDTKATYDQLVSDYLNQPNLNVRSGDSMNRQAYSTPAPLAYAVAVSAGMQPNVDTTDNSAGNGMLLSFVDKDKAYANELDGERAAALKDQGLNVTQGDALKGGQADRFPQVIVNPPFGNMEKLTGTKFIEVGDTKLYQIDHAIVAKAFEQMMPDGKGAMIIGANKKVGTPTARDRNFFRWLYQNYNVTAHTEVDGKLYTKQGASWPVRVITVDGRREAPDTEILGPNYDSVKRLESWEQVYDELVSADRTRPSTSELYEFKSGEAAARLDEIAGTGTDTKAGKGSKVRGNGGSKPSSNNTGGSGVDGSGSTVKQTGSTNQTTQGKPGSSENGGGVRAKPDTGSAKQSTVKDNGLQRTYQGASSGFNMEALIPSNMATPVTKFQKRLRKEVGDIDTYVAKKLGYKTIPEMHAGLAGQQVDGVAAGIYNIERGKAVIVADTTGQGKGRQAAAMIRYALTQGKTPIFFTEKANLFTDMYEDMQDIGMDVKDIKPFIMNASAEIAKDPGDGKIQRIIPKAGTAKQKAFMQTLIDTGKLPKDNNMLMTNYSQVTTDNLQRQALKQLVDRDDVLFILDEAHNMAGNAVSGTGKNRKITGGGYLRNLIKGKPTMYLSATYAKRPENMAAFNNTDLGALGSLVESAKEDGEQNEAEVQGAADMEAALSRGGAALQATISYELSEEGQLIRRERSFAGIQVNAKVDEGNKKRDLRISDQLTVGLRAIAAADKMFHNGWVKNLKKQIKGADAEIAGAGNRASSNVNHAGFNSVMHNYITQLLLGLKADIAANEAIELHKQGQKPVIGLYNTMEGFIDANDGTVGEPFEADFRDILKRALERTRRVSIDRNGEKTVVDIPLEKLDAATAFAYEEAERAIDKLDLGDVPVSPIDWMLHKMSEAGMNVGELTGRQLRLDYSTTPPTVIKRDKAELKNRRLTVDGFNNNDKDALILNAAGATGLSIHASEKFLPENETKKRHMIIVQPPPDVNVMMQMLGRINRTGQYQSILPEFTFLTSASASEKRPMAAALKKLMSLNANTSANTEGSTTFDALDFLNYYGDIVVTEFLRDNPDFAKKIPDAPRPEEGKDIKDPEKDIALKVSGRVAAYATEAEKQEFYDEVEARYRQRIEYENAMGTNRLSTDLVNLEADIIASDVLFEGDKTNSVLSGSTTTHVIESNVQGKSFDADEVAKMVADSTDPIETINSIMDDKIAEAAKQKLQDAYIAFRQRFGTNITDPSDVVLSVIEDKAERAEAKKIKEAYSKAKNDRDTRIAQSRDMAVRFAERFAPGTTVQMKDSDTKGVVTKINMQARKRGNPFAPSSITVEVATNSPVGIIKIPLTQFDQFQKADFDPKDHFFAQTNAREQRTVMTGNLVYPLSKQYDGQIVNFTDKTGNEFVGFLMPWHFDSGIDVVSDTEFDMKKPEAALEVLKSKGELESKDGIKLTHKDGSYTMQFPKSNMTNAMRRFKSSWEPRAMGFDFYTQPSQPYYEARPREEQALRIIKKMRDRGMFFTMPESERQSYVDAGGSERAKAAKSFDAPPLRKVRDAKPASTADAKKYQKIADKIQGVKVNVVDTHKDLPYDAKPGDVGGVYGQVYINAEQIRGPVDFNTTLMHEITGHMGVEAVVGDDWTQVKQSIDALKGHDKLKSEIRKNYPDDQFYKEFMARLAEKRATDNEVRQVFRLIRSLLSKGLRKLGITGRTPAVELDKIIDQAMESSPVQPVSSDGRPVRKLRVDAESLSGVKKTASAVRQAIARNKLAVLNRRQLVDNFKSILPRAINYLEAAEAAEALKSGWQIRAGQAAERASKFAKKQPDMMSRLSDIIHNSTIAGVDPSDYQELDLADINRKIERLIEKKRNDLPEAAKKELIELEKDRAIAWAELNKAKNRPDKKGARGVSNFRKVERIEKRIKELREEAKSTITPAEVMRLEYLKHIRENADFRKAEAAKILKEWDALPTEAKEIYVEFKKYHEDMFDAQTDAMIERLEASNIGETEKLAQIAAIRQARQDMKLTAPYHPLSRFGEYHASVTWPDGDNEYRQFATLYEQERWVNQAKEKGATVNSDGKKKEEVRAEDKLPESLRDALLDMVEDHAEGNPDILQLKGEIHQLYLKSLPSLSARKHEIRRGNVRGYDDDALKSFSHTAMHAAAHLSRIKHGWQMAEELRNMDTAIDIATRENYKELHERSIKEIEDAIDTGVPIDEIAEKFQAFADESTGDAQKHWEKLLVHTRSGKPLDTLKEQYEQNLKDAESIGHKDRVRARNAHSELQKSYEWTMNPQVSQWASMASGFTFTWLLAATPAAALINTSQLWMVTLPQLGARYGAGKVAKELASAQVRYVGESIKNREMGFDQSKLSDEERQALDELESRGIFSRTLTNELAGLADEGIDTNTTYAKAMKILGITFAATERNNREINALVAYNLAKNSGKSHKQAIQEAHDSVQDTQFDYSNAARARILTGDIARVIGTYKSYAFSYSYVWYSNFKKAIGKSDATPEEKREAQKMLTTMLGMQFALSGVLGLPLARTAGSAVETVVNLFLDDEDEVEYEAWSRNFMSDLFGTTASAAIMKGPWDAIPGNPFSGLSDRVSASALFFREGSPSDEAGEDTYYNAIDNLLGPTFGVAKNFFMATKDFGDGNMHRGLEKTMPKVLRDLSKTGRYWYDGGVESRKGDMIYEMNGMDLLRQAMGFTPSGLTDAYTRNSFIYGRDKQLREVRSQIMRLNNEGLASEDKDKQAKARELAKKFTKKFPDLAIEEKNFKRSWRSFQRQRESAVAGVSATTKTKKQAIADVRF